MALEFETYIEGTRTTAVYPGFNTGDGRELSYLALGLADEWGELLEAGAFIATAKTYDRVLREMGDVAWYLFRTFDALALDPTPSVVHEDDMFTTIPIHIGKICGLVKKVLRGDGIDLHAEGSKRYEIHQHLSIVLGAFIALAEFHGIKFETVLRKNYEKLTKRKAAGTLKGSGDDR